MILDCFTFFNENDLLEIRLNTLNEIVDKFIIVEANQTHSGISKPFYYDKKRFDKFKDKIIYIELKDRLNFSNSWKNENFQRNYILDILKQENCKDEDVVILTDLDEIPNVNAIKEFLQNPSSIYAFQMDIYNYYLNLRNLSEGIWTMAKILKYAEFQNLENDYNNYGFGCEREVNDGITPTKVRMMCNNKSLPNGGWHFTYMGGVNKIQEKLISFAHQEFNNPYFIDKNRLEECLKTNTDVLNRNYNFKVINIEKYLPEYIVQNAHKFSHLML